MKGVCLGTTVLTYFLENSPAMVMSPDCQQEKHRALSFAEQSAQRCKQNLFTEPALKTALASKENNHRITEC